MPFGTFLAYALPVLAIVGFVVYVNRHASAKEDRFYSALKAINIEHGTKFPTHSGEKHLLQMGSLPFTNLLFDTDKRLVAIWGGESFEVKPLSYLRNWQLTWNEDGDGRPCDVTMNLGTTDVNRPNLRVSFYRKLDEGQEWRQRMDLIMNASAA